MKNQFYPLTFTPIMKERIWGGTKLADYLHKSIPSAQTGESWELSTVPGDVSVVANGPLCGTSLQALLDQFPAEVLGSQIHAKYGTQFPLLFKFWMPAKICLYRFIPMTNWLRRDTTPLERPKCGT